MYITKTDKQLFDLKLELFHGRQRAESLESQLEKMKVLETENEEIQKTNEELFRELEQRDTAIREAVNMICGLEREGRCIGTGGGIQEVLDCSS